MPKTRPLTKLQLRKLRKERNESDVQEDLYHPVRERDANADVPARRRVTEPLPDFENLPSFKRFKLPHIADMQTSGRDADGKTVPKRKMSRKGDVGKASELRRDARRAEGGDMYLGYRGEGKVVE